MFKNLVLYQKFCLFKDLNAGFGMLTDYFVNKLSVKNTFFNKNEVVFLFFLKKIASNFMFFLS